MEKYIRPPVEVLYEKELSALEEEDKGAAKPEGWRLSPKAIRTFILGSKKPLSYNEEKVQIKQKYFGDDALVERCIITLAGNRGLMLVGEPGTAKTMLSELLSAAVSGSSTNTVQGTAGTTEDNIKYSWNYALLLDKGAGMEALVPAPLFTGMQDGKITRFEEVTRCPSEVQDTLISVMSDKVLNIPELGEEGFIFAKPGFNVIATANTRDKGVNEMSSALKRRFNFETVFPINSVSLESKIIEDQASALLHNMDTKKLLKSDIIEVIATTFYELREGMSAEGAKIDAPSAVMSTAEAVSVYFQSALSAHYYNDDYLTMDTIVQNMVGAVMKDSRDDLPKLRSYFNTVIKQRASKSKLWKEYYEARKNIN